MTPKARDDIAWLADEQAALRRVATFVARAPDPVTVFDMVTREASQLLDLPVLTLMRFESDGTVTVLAAASVSPYPVGANIVLDGPSVIATILETGQQARIDSYEGLPGAVAARLRSAGAQAAYGVPILVDDKVWGVMAAVLTDGVVADDAEQRLANFTEKLIATAVSEQHRREMTSAGLWPSRLHSAG